jgi:hypothetical protein
MIREVAEGVEDLGEREMREMSGDFFGCDAHSPVFQHSSSSFPSITGLSDTSRVVIYTGCLVEFCLGTVSCDFSSLTSEIEQYTGTLNRKKIIETDKI